MRFYPSNIASFPYEPSTEDFSVSAINDTIGQGVVSLKDFDQGDILFAFRGDIIPHITQYTLQIDAFRHIDDPYFCGKLQHSCGPNAMLDMQNLMCIALRPIQAGESITIDYDATEERLFRPFQCSCGSPNCRGWVYGFKVEVEERDLASA
jgi:hypothetical protein